MRALILTLTALYILILWVSWEGCKTDRGRTCETLSAITFEIVNKTSEVIMKSILLLLLLAFILGLFVLAMIKSDTGPLWEDQSTDNPDREGE